MLPNGSSEDEAGSYGTSPHSTSSSTSSSTIGSTLRASTTGLPTSPASSISIDTDRAGLTDRLALRRPDSISRSKGGGGGGPSATRLRSRSSHFHALGCILGYNY
ncbi:hypothetical protein BCR33DRAFT_297416 [Rhizoclosmatium globosum]|uniref:Uncharacterized protein n=1 Tax=Rhizoclosmatium globosum TaxID=329046 RepID=A0A1Y2C672_9FUNG|nr:hypothetical protein BCR33DRAFT_297416 [Rhizoclosmatium globosum]|eukprot:ORY42538.1 hypothetical protein BCR33DRAFT_297416 [Rhizoclosmatium globosum]